MTLPMIHFRRVDEPFAANGVERWQAEYYDEGSMFPVGLAWVAVVGGVAQLNFFIVADEWRRRGIGRSLLQSCKDRWAVINPTGAMNDAAERLLRSVFGRGEDE